MRCSGSETFVTSTSAIPYDSTGSLFIDGGGAWISCLSCSLAHSLSVPPFHPPSLCLSLLLSLSLSSFFLYLFPPFPLSAPTSPSALFSSLLLSPLGLSLLHSSSMWEKMRKISWRKGCPSSQALSPFRSLHGDLSSDKDCSAMEFTVLLSNEFSVREAVKKGRVT